MQKFKISALLYCFFAFALSVGCSPFIHLLTNRKVNRGFGAQWSKTSSYMKILCLSTQTVVKDNCVLSLVNQGQVSQTERVMVIVHHMTPQANISQYVIASLLMGFYYFMGESPEKPPTENQTAQCPQAGQEQNS